MSKKHTAMVINDVFEKKNMLILKSEGSEIIINYNERITSEELHVILKRENISVDDCKIIVVNSSNMKGDLQIESH